MKKVSLAVLGVFLFIVSSCSNNENEVEEIEVHISQQEIDDLKFLREEEKLARDVYLYSYEKYGETIFNSISQSEQQHMNSVLTLLNKYQIIDPASSERGVFTNQVLQSLYDDLIELSDVSLVEALKVGAFIEDLDINDLVELQSLSSLEDIINMCELLECGSRNHLRNFSSILESNSYNYVPVYISLEDYNEIINSTVELCSSY